MCEYTHTHTHTHTQSSPKTTPAGTPQQPSEGEPFSSGEGGSAAAKVSSDDPFTAFEQPSAQQQKVSVCVCVCKCEASTHY